MSKLGQLPVPQKAHTYMSDNEFTLKAILDANGGTLGPVLDDLTTKALKLQAICQNIQMGGNSGPSASGT
jgi:ACT domain-containing protein